MEGKTLTRTVQPITWTAVKKAENTKKREPEENIADGNIQLLLAICDSLNTLFEKLNRLDYLLKREIIKKQEGIL
ncbi:MAG: hypothetical protein LBQ93_01730 [Treponema sp.]|jgi:hypothetical protein|nr:hypothetical protein [Treponema sp.]